MSKQNYVKPDVELIYVEVEAGFEASNDWGLPGENPDENDFGEF